jgi:hypothetical protein
MVRLTVRFGGLNVQEHPSEGAKRPIAVTFVGVLALVVGAAEAVDGIFAVVNGGTSSKLAEGAFDLALGVLAIAIGIGALRVRRWAWAAFMTWAVVGLTHQLLRHFFYNDPSYLAMALDTVAVLALTPFDVQVAFGARPPRNLVLERAARHPVDGS